MKVAVIPAYNEEITIGSIVIGAKSVVDTVIVVDDASTDRTAEIASKAGAEVIRNAENLGHAIASSTGLAGALKYNPEYIVELDGDGHHNPGHIPTLLGPLMSGRADIATVEHTSGFIAFSPKAFPLLSKPRIGLGANDEILMEATSQGLRIERISLGLEPSSGRQFYESFLKYYSEVLEEHAIDRISRLSTLKEIYDERRKVQQEMSTAESYRLVSETFLKFIPPALLSLIISLIVLAPSTGFKVDLPVAAALVCSVVAVFFVSWWILTRILGRIYGKQAYLEALTMHETEVRQQQREESGYKGR
jgi:glycosyltransferase involved in cell wall biosynthesis